MRVLQMVEIGKSFGRVTALSDVSINLEPGEIRGVVGENGAGKSTLMKILSGAIRADTGKVIVNGEDLSNAPPSTILDRGIAVIYQEFAQAPHLSVAENIALGALPQRGWGIIDRGRMLQRAREALATLGFGIDVTQRVADLSVAHRQIVEIARAIERNARIIVLDEPSAVLGEAEVAALFKLMRSLATERQVAFLYVSHRLDEVFDICDSVTILRDGRHVETGPIADFTRGRLIGQMVGRELSDLYPPRRALRETEIVLSTRGLTRNGVIDDISIDVGRGEIVGICGLSGAGRSEVLMALAGADAVSSGEISVDGKRVHLRSPIDAIRLGVGFIPEDRKLQGLCLNQSVGFNMMLSAFGKFQRAGVIARTAERADVDDKVTRLRVKTSSQDTVIGNLSGGNQQKCLLGRQVIAGSRILLIDEPTRGVDVGARREIYDLLVELAERDGISILMVSSELPEILGLCDRIYVMREGRVVADLVGSSSDEATIMAHAAN